MTVTSSPRSKNNIMAKAITYNKAYEELQSIVEKLQSEDINLDNLGKEVKRAAELVNICKTKLRTIETEIEESLK